MEKFLNRELSTLEFNGRVLAEAMDTTNPLFERLKFTGIVSSNLDEFFMVRIASLSRASAEGNPGHSDPLLASIFQKARLLIELQNTHFMESLVPEMASHGLIRLQPETLDNTQSDFAKNFFHRELLPVLTPVGLSDDRPFPTITNLRLHLAVSLIQPSLPGVKKVAVVEIPQNFPRLVFLPGGKTFLLLEDIVGQYVQDLFPGCEIVEKGLIRLTRAAETTLDEEKDEDFMKVMAEALRHRRQAQVVRLEINGSPELLAFFGKALDVPAEAIYSQAGWLDLKTISQLAFQPGFDELKRPAWEPCLIPELEAADNLWQLLRSRNLVVFHPYQTFDIVNHFVAKAADDPDVLAIKQTLYRTDQDSEVVRSLERAAENGKNVTVLVELKARFDEEKNILWARRLEMAGASVLYGVAGLKTHAKACLVVRREPEGIRRYAHLSTGNYNQRTARVYSDIGFFTSDEDLTNDLTGFFNMITGYSQPLPWRKIEVAPYGMRARLLRLIRREAKRTSTEKPGAIFAKMNSLVDEEIIEALYAASKAGVQIKLNVRGICRLRPGVKDLSETIEVISIVDQFLEHSRIFWFSNGGNEQVYLSSADWMPRNLDRRIEILFPVEDKDNKKLLTEHLRLYFRDNMKSWRLNPDGSYKKIDHEPRKKFRAQEALCEQALHAEEAFEKSAPQELKPQRPSVDK